ncbi:MAG: hypothetical protein ACD_71C00056G0004 [uncultured bacterium (gcode 4)]|uniref:Uncharacterized protein n=1 Tax=uncultured bacterium (gcode 4) TaxID=1234023 RepID=K2A3Q2_9BACT|nr:MAG: hypothetical protein ACD_71C00056G0004 [uncultured bacterium (gcode 4)]
MAESVSSSQVFEVKKIEWKEDRIVFNEKNWKLLFESLIEKNNNDRTSKLLYWSKHTPDGLVKSVSSMIEDFNNGIDINVLVSRKDKWQTLEISKAVSENDFDKRIVEEVQKLNWIIQTSSNGMWINLDNLVADLWKELDVPSFVSKLPEVWTLDKISMIAWAWDYKKKPAVVAEWQPDLSWSEGNNWQRNFTAAAAKLMTWKNAKEIYRGTDPSQIK